MKTIKFFLVSLFMILGLAAQAQQVVIYKTDGTTETFQASEVDSVVYATKTYKYYLGVQTEEVITSTTSVNNLISSSTQTATSKHTEITWPTATSNDYYQLYVYPTSWGIIKGLTNKSDSKPIGYMKAHDLGITAPSGYDVIAISDAKTFGGTTSVITW